MSDIQNDSIPHDGGAADFVKNTKAVTYDAWRADVSATLQGAPFEKKLVTRTHEGFDLEPLYSPDHPRKATPPGLPGVAPFVRHESPLGAVRAGWEVRQTYAHPSIEATSGEILEDLAGGVTGLHVCLHAALRAGADADEPAARPLVGVQGVAVSTTRDLDRLLTGVDLGKVAIALDAGANAIPAAAALIAVAKERGVPTSALRGTLCADPLGALARDGRLPTSLDRSFALLADLAAYTNLNAPGLRAVLVSTTPYHEAGAAAVDEVAFAIATGVEYLRRLVQAGLTVDVAARQLNFEISVACDTFTGIAKLRAARKLWCAVVAQSGGSSAAQAMVVHARGSERVLTKRDPWVNLLRATVEGFAAAAGGASSIGIPAFDQPVGPSDSLARRMARNTQIILRDESNLHRVIDPAGGSFFVEDLTETIARSAWARFQEMEGAKGMAAQLLSGAVLKRVAETASKRKQAVATRRDPITGVSEFANVREMPIVREPVNVDRVVAVASAALAEARRKQDQATHLPAKAPLGNITAAAIVEAARSVTLGAISRALGGTEVPLVGTPLPVLRTAQAFEDLRDASDENLSKTGHRPRVFLANIGPIPQHKPRATFATNFFAAGGFEVLENDGFADADTAATAFAASQADVAIICSTDAVYPEVVPPLAKKLKAKGARVVVLAGRGGDLEASFKAAGVDTFIFMGCDVVSTLRNILATVGVSH